MCWPNTCASALTRIGETRRSSRRFPRASPTWRSWTRSDSWTSTARIPSRHTWTYVGNLGGSAPTVDVLASQPPDQQAQVVIQQVADRRARVLADAWERLGNIGHCVWVAVREEGVDGATLDQVLAPYWPVLWRLAARGHWIRHHHRPVRVTGTDEGHRGRADCPAADLGG